jgi:tRNA (uracil-5-)-methyltransferase
MVSLIYHKSLDTNWIEDAQNLSSKIGVSIIGRSKKQKLVIGKDFVTETYKAKDQTIKIDLYEQCFSQTNPYICDQMLSWVSEREDLSSHVTELHCGIGTFTALLSNIFSKVLATENSRPSIKALKENLKNNFITNVQFARMSGLETLEALNKVRVFNRLKHVNLKNLKKDVLFLDPPKSGLDSLSLDLIKQLNFKEIIYLSCGFPSLKSNINNLLSDYYIEKAAFFDQFPFTDHLETGVILKKRVTT